MLRARALLLVLGLALNSRPATGQGFNALSASAAPAQNLIINMAIAGQQPTDFVDASATFTVGTIFGGAKKIVASLNTPMPAGVTLTATFPAVGGGSSSSGAVILSTTARDVVINFANIWNQTRNITYRLSATVAAGVVPSQSRIVALTLVNYP